MDLGWWRVIYCVIAKAKAFEPAHTTQVGLYFYERNAHMAEQDATTQQAAPSVNDERAQRRARRQTLLDQGINPYPIQSHVTAHAAELEKRYVDLEDGGDTDDVVTLGGRIRALSLIHI